MTLNSIKLEKLRDLLKVLRAGKVTKFETSELTLELDTEPTYIVKDEDTKEPVKWTAPDEARASDNEERIELDELDLWNT